MGPYLFIILDLIQAYSRRRNDPNWRMYQSAIDGLRKVYNDTRKAISQSGEMDETEEAALDDRASAVFASVAADPNQNT